MGRSVHVGDLYRGRSELRAGASPQFHEDVGAGVIVDHGETAAGDPDEPGFLVQVDGGSQLAVRAEEQSGRTKCLGTVDRCGYELAADAASLRGGATAIFASSNTASG
jgi:hypothetical protein